MSYKDDILKLTIQLLPEGRAFKMKDGGLNHRRESVFADIVGGTLDDVHGILDSILADNNNFTEDDATKWEVRLGMIVQDSSVPLQDRKDAILRKYNHPGTIVARQSSDYIEGQLILAGFTNVKVYGNIDRLPPVAYVGIQATGIAECGGDCQYSEEIEYGQLEEGAVFENMIANHIDEQPDKYFDIGDNLSGIFYISGATLGDFINIDINRKDEFRQLLMKLKPANQAGVLFVNYV